MKYECGKCKQPMFYYFDGDNDIHVFRCSNCGYEITVADDEE